MRCRRSLPTAGAAVSRRVVGCSKDKLCGADIAEVDSGSNSGQATQIEADNSIDQQRTDG